jgi:hypothetical protein
MLIPDVTSGIEIGVALMRTLTTAEGGLRDAIAAGDVPADAAPLRGVPGIHLHHAAALRLGFIFDEALQLREAPRMQSPSGFAAPGLDAAADVREILEDDDRARLGPANDLFREGMIAIPSEPHVAAREASKVPFGALRAVSLQFLLEAQPVRFS